MVRNINEALKYEKNRTASDGAWLLLAEVTLGFTRTVTNISQAACGIVTTEEPHDLITGQKVSFTSVVGMTEINGLDPVEVTVKGEYVFAIDLDTSGFTEYVSGGTMTLDTLRFARNFEDVVYLGNTYLGFPFEIGDIITDKEGELPSVTVRLSNVTRLLQPYIEVLEGAVGATLKIIIINSNYPSVDCSELEWQFSVISCKSSPRWIEFQLGSPSELREIFPLLKYYSTYCQWDIFGGDECKYSGSETSCDRTLRRCLELGNEVNFGGFPGLSGEGIRIVG